MSEDVMRRLAVPFEVDAIKSYLTGGILLAKGDPFSSERADALMALWAAGIEHLFKIALIAASGFDSGAIRTIDRGLLHNITYLWASVDQLIVDHPGSARGHIFDARNAVANDPVGVPLLAALTAYARSGRYYMLDVMDGRRQVNETPFQLWNDVRNSVEQDPVVATAAGGAGEDHWSGASMSRWRVAQSGRLIVTVERLWWLVADALRNGLFGENGRAAGADLLPDKSFRPDGH